MIRVLTVRHEQSTYNEKKIITGNLNPPLTKNGIDGAERAKNYFLDYTIEEILTGTLDRQVKTTQIIEGGRGITITYDDRMNERDLARFQGAPYDNINTEGITIQRYLLLKDILNDESNPHIPIIDDKQGEMIKGVRGRAKEFLEERILKKYGGYDEVTLLLVVSELWHSYFLNELIQPKEGFVCYSLDNGAYSELHIDHPTEPGKRIIGIERTNIPFIRPSILKPS